MGSALTVYCKEVFNITNSNNNLRQLLYQAQHNLVNSEIEIGNLKEEIVKGETINRELVAANKVSNIISSNAILLFKSFDLYSSIRKPALVKLSNGLKVNTASKMFGVAASVISRARSSADITILSFRWKKKILRGPRVNVELIQAFWLEVCIVPSGSRRTIRIKLIIGTQVRYGVERVPVHIQTCTNLDMYIQFKIR